MRLPPVISYFYQTFAAPGALASTGLRGRMWQPGVTRLGRYGGKCPRWPSRASQAAAVATKATVETTMAAVASASSTR